MRRLLLPLLLASFPLVFLSAADAEGLRGRVVGISDGDTLTLLTPSKREERVRLAEIDAPEKGQPFASRSRESLSNLAYGKEARVESKERDRYGRIVGRVYIGTVDVSAEQVRRGMAWVYVKYVEDPALPKLEAEARAGRRGVFSDPTAVPPWEFRAEGRRENAPKKAGSVDRRSSTSGAAAPFRCGEKRFCREMTSCAEAKFHLERCRLSTIDGDGNGSPCEKMCG